VKGQPGFERRIPYSHIRSAHVLYRSGMSILEVSELIYERYGYANARACSHTLQRTFRRLGFPVRSHDEAQRVRALKQVCTQCGCHVNKRTRGCSNCNRRHWERQQAGSDYATPERPSGFCAGCGCPWQERSYACQPCIKRHHGWMIRGLPYVPAIGKTYCRGCGCTMDERTPGCDTCTTRHWRRKARKNGPAHPSPRTENRESTPGGAVSPKRKAAAA
jgi:hypothetical protein